jgi:predicted amidohydrolase
VDVSVALVQLAVSADKGANLAKVEAATAAAARRGARLVVFPEATMHHFGRPDEPLGPAAEPLDGPFARACGALARSHRVFILAGMFERSDDAARPFNTLALFAEDGSLHAAYRKIHLYDAFGYRESDRLTRGDGDTLTFDVDGMRFGAMTCYDLRFAELARRLTAEGAQALLLPAAWLAGPLKEMQFATLLRARAIENTVYVGAADQCTDGFCGGSVLYDPHGVVVASLGEAEGTIVAAVSAERVAAVRARNPSLANARGDVYARWAAARQPA